MKRFGLWLLCSLLSFPAGAGELDGLLKKHFTTPIAPKSADLKDGETRIAALYPTFFYVEERGRLLQIVRAEMEIRGAGNEDLELMAEAPDQSAYANPIRPLPGKNSYTVKIPALEQPGEIKVYLTENQRLVDIRTFDWPAAKLYKVYVSFVSHLDLGYTGTQEQVFKKRDAITERALEFAEQTRDWPEDARFRWTFEGSWEVKHFLETHPEKLPELQKLAAEGRIEVTSKLTHMHSETAGYEELFRENYYALRELEPLLKTRVLTAMENDVDGFTWGEVQVLSSSGVKYFSFNPNFFYRGGNILHATKFPQAFWWQGPDDSRLLTWRSKNAYTEASYLFSGYRKTLGGLTELLGEYEKSGFPYDAIHLTRSGADFNMANDNSWPKLEACETIREWNSHFAYPRLISATPAMFFDYLEKNFGGQIPLAKGDMPDWWADGVISSAYEEAISRSVHHDLFKLENFASLASLLVPGYQYPKKTIDDAYYNNILFDEHTFGFSLQTDPRFKKIFNTKAGWLKQAWFNSSAKGYLAMLELYKRIAGTEQVVVVFNPLSWARSTRAVFALTPLWFEKHKEKYIRVKDAVSGEEVPVQFEEKSSGKVFAIHFVARDVPALGYRSYKIVPSPDQPQYPSAIVAGDNRMENERFALEFGPDRQLKSIIDKKLGRELLNGNANQYIYRKQDLLFNAVDFRKIGRVKSLKISAGPVFATAVLEVADPANPLARLTQKITLYQGLDYIDIDNSLSRYSNRAAEARYFAFPFNVPDFEIRVETPYGKMRPYYDQLPDYAKFYTVSHYIELESKRDNFSVIWSTKEAPMVELGETTKPASWTSQAFRPFFYHAGKYPWNPDKPTVYSEIMNNFQNTNFPPAQRGSMKFNYRITAIDASESDRAHQSGWELSMPAMAILFEPQEKAATLPPGGSFIKLSPNNAMLTELKQAEDGDGYVIRVYEAEGKAAAAVLEFPLFRVSKAWLTDGVERVQSELPVKDGKITLGLAPFSVKTIKISMD